MDFGVRKMLKMYCIMIKNNTFKECSQQIVMKNAIHKIKKKNFKVFLNNTLLLHLYFYV